MFKCIASCFIDKGYTRSKTYQALSPIKGAIKTDLGKSANDTLINLNKCVIKKALDNLVDAATIAQAS